MSFNATADMSASFDTGGAVSMPVKRLADVMPAGQQVYAKFDIEGAEWDALSGSAEHVTDNNPSWPSAFSTPPRIYGDCPC